MLPSQFRIDIARYIDGFTPGLGRIMFIVRPVKLIQQVARMHGRAGIGKTTLIQLFLAN